MRNYTQKNHYDFYWDIIHYSLVKVPTTDLVCQQAISPDHLFKAKAISLR
jgi:hypothetical protein